MELCYFVMKMNIEKNHPWSCCRSNSFLNHKILLMRLVQKSCAVDRIRYKSIYINENIYKCYVFWENRILSRV
jgi:hypothetical protein